MLTCALITTITKVIRESGDSNLNGRFDIIFKTQGHQDHHGDTTNTMRFRNEGRGELCGSS